MDAKAERLVAVPILPCRFVERFFSVFSGNDLPNAQSVAFGKVKITLVMGRDGHDSPLAVTH